MTTEPAKRPWAYREMPRDHGHYYILDGDGLIVATLGEFSSRSTEREANAHLIAASPDLLAACKAALHVAAVVDCWDACEAGTSPRLAFTQPKAAIAQAEGGGK